MISMALSKSGWSDWQSMTWRRRRSFRLPSNHNPFSNFVGFITSCWHHLIDWSRDRKTKDKRPRGQRDLRDEKTLESVPHLLPEAFLKRNAQIKFLMENMMMVLMLTNLLALVVTVVVVVLINPKTLILHAGGFHVKWIKFKHEFYLS